MLLTKLKKALAVMLVGVLVTGAGVSSLIGQDRAADKQATPPSTVDGQQEPGRERDGDREAGRKDRRSVLIIKDAYVKEVDTDVPAITVIIGRKKWVGGNLAGRNGKVYWAQKGRLRMHTTLTDVLLAEDAAITSGNKKWKLADLKKGTIVTLELTADQDRLLVRAIRVTAPPPREAPLEGQPDLPARK